jgi:hypothetical protein
MPRPAHVLSSATYRVDERDIELGTTNVPFATAFGAKSQHCARAARRSASLPNVAGTSYRLWKSVAFCRANLGSHLIVRLRLVAGRMSERDTPAAPDRQHPQGEGDQRREHARRPHQRVDAPQHCGDN